MRDKISAFGISKESLRCFAEMEFTQHWRPTRSRHARAIHVRNMGITEDNSNRNSKQTACNQRSGDAKRHGCQKKSKISPEIHATRPST
jgi:hypothetical protein